MAVQKADWGHTMRVIIKQVWKRSILKLEERRGWIKNKEQQQKKMFKKVDCEQHWKCSREVI